MCFKNEEKCIIEKSIRKIINKQIDLKNKVRDKDKDAQDIKDLVDANDKLSITLGVNQRHSNSQVNIQNTNAMQTVTKIEHEFID